jgi:hypothetical protein
MITKNLSVKDLLQTAANELNKACDSHDWEKHVMRAEPALVVLMALIRAQDDNAGIHEEVRECTIKM